MEQLSRVRGLRGSVAHTWTTAPCPAETAPVPEWLHPALHGALADLAIPELYTHQAEALEHLHAGRNCVVATGTASGKTYCYNLPVFDAILRRGTTRALYLFPTKALAQDQLRRLTDMLREHPVALGAYDGDTPQSQRAAIRRAAHVVMTNPDMLHVGVLPNHHLWADFFANLRYVVIDELHTFHGVFGSNAAHLFRRLRRVCEAYGAHPLFVASSATIANPRELAEKLVGLPFALVDHDGAPRGAKAFALCSASPAGSAEPMGTQSTSPPPSPCSGTPSPRAERGQGPEGPGVRSPDESSADREAEDSREATAAATAHGLAARLVAHLASEGIRTIAFVQSRRSAETLLLRARGLLAAGRRGSRGKVLAYRGGYLPEERRQIESDLSSGRLAAVVATSALELGIDIGGLQACVILGYPGTTASFLQQAGRVGRTREGSIVVLLAQDSTLDQYVARHPEILQGAAPERVVVDPTNRFVLGAHLLCAAHELPISTEEYQTTWGDCSEAAEILERLAESGYVEFRRKWYARSTLAPATLVSLRSSAGPAYEIVHAEGGGLVGTVDAGTALFYLHPQAVYLHQGEKYLILDLDTERRRATVTPTQLDYLTTPMILAEAAMERELTRVEAGRATALYGEMTMTSRLCGYTKLTDLGRRPPEVVPLEFPPQTLETVGVQLRFPPALMGDLAAAGCDAAGSLHALEHAAIAVLPLLTSCGRHDVLGYSTVADRASGAPVVTVCDNHPGGIGITEAAYEHLDELATLVERAVRECPCSGGCPSCVQSPSCGSDNKPLDKLGAIRLAGWCRAEAGGSPDAK